MIETFSEINKIRKEIDLIDERLTEARQKLNVTALDPSKVTRKNKGFYNDDTIKKLDKIAELEQIREDTVKILFLLWKEADQIISQINNPVAALIISLHYKTGATWKETAAKTGYSVDYCKALSRKYLNNYNQKINTV